MSCRAACSAQHLRLLQLHCCLAAGSFAMAHSMKNFQHSTAVCADTCCTFELSFQFAPAGSFVTAHSLTTFTWHRNVRRHLIWCCTLKLSSSSVAAGSFAMAHSLTTSRQHRSVRRHAQWFSLAAATNGPAQCWSMEVRCTFSGSHGLLVCQGDANRAVF
jgi:hypothetical protein